MNNNQPLTATKIYNQIYHEVLFITSRIFREQEPQPRTTEQMQRTNAEPMTYTTLRAK
jgi:hypothetical protein